MKKSDTPPPPDGAGEVDSTEAAEGRSREAIVFVHGIGEQRLNESALEFARSIAPDPHRVFPVPTRLKNYTHQNVYRVQWNPKGEPTLATDVYEGYWAPNYRDTTASHLFGWLREILGRQTAAVPRRLLGPKWSFYLAIAISLIGIAAVYLGVLLAMSPTNIAWFAGTTAAVGVAMVIISVFRLVISRSLVRRLVVGVGVGVVVIVVAVLIATSMTTGVDNLNQLDWVPDELDLVLVRIGLLVLFMALVLSLFAGSVASLLAAVLLVVGATGSALHLLLTRDFATVQSWVAIVIAVLVALVIRPILPSIGDAARYLNETTENLASNETVTTTVVDLLRHIHNDRNDWGLPTYDRVIVVGHSLGSVIALQALETYWQEIRFGLGFVPHTVDTSCRCPCAKREQGFADISAEIERLQTSTSKPTIEAVLNYRGAQNLLYQALNSETFEGLCSTCAGADRRLSEPGGRPARAPHHEHWSRWAVSDFITIGSPLANADFLSRLRPRNAATIKSAAAEARSTALVPPILQSGAVIPTVTHPLRSADHSENLLRFPHYRALFAPTRWTNLYFSNDLVGGPVAPLYGPGAIDIEVSVRWASGDKRTLALPPAPAFAFLAYSHSSYWRFDESGLLKVPAKRSRETMLRLLDRRLTVREVVGSAGQVSDSKYLQWRRKQIDPESRMNYSEFVKILSELRSGGEHGGPPLALSAKASSETRIQRPLSPPTDEATSEEI